MVAPGTYTEALDFLGKDLVLRSTDGPDVTTIRQPSGNTPTISMTSGEPETALVRGFTFNAQQPTSSSGSALYIESSSGRFNENVVTGVGGIHVLDGWIEAQQNRFLDTARNKATLFAEGSHALFTGNQVTGASGSNVLLLYAGSRPDATIEIVGNRIVGTTGRPVYSPTPEAPVFRDNFIVDNDGGLVITGVAPVVENNVMARNGRTTNNSTAKQEIHFRGSDGGVFANNAVIAEDNPGRHMYFSGPASTVVSNNVLVGKKDYGLIDCTNNVTMRYNTIWNPKKHQSIVGNCSSIGQNNNVQAEPGFVDIRTLELHPAPGSPLIDSGKASDAPAADAEGNPRPQDGDGDGIASVDRGAYELTESSIQGTVSSSGRPRQGICVSAHKPNSLAEVTRTATSDSGGYRLNVSPGNYKVQFVDCADAVLDTEWFDDEPTPQAAATVAVGASQDVTGIDADLFADLICDGRAVTIIGTNGKDTITGTAGPDVIASLGGKDTVISGKGDDVLCGGTGNDKLKGGSGSDVIFGEGGNDTLNGGSGGDDLFGGDGDDTFMGSSGSDSIDGGPHSVIGYLDTIYDTLDLSAAPAAVTVKLNKNKIVGWGGKSVTGVERVIGGDFDDRLIGDGAVNILHGGAGNDFLDGKKGDNRLFGDEGHDTLITARSTNNFLHGGRGDDLFTLGVDGNNTVEGSYGIDALVFRSPEAPIAIGSRDIFYRDWRIDWDDLEIFEGTPFNDVIAMGGTNSDESDIFVFAGAGNDTLEGTRAEQYLDGGPGDDTLISHRGRHTLVGGAGDDHLESKDGGALMAPGSGIDMVIGSAHPEDTVTFELEPSAVVIDLGFGVATWAGGTAALEDIEYAVGSAHADNIRGASGENILIGGDGSDTLTGGPGDDWCFDGESHSGCEHIEQLGSALSLAKQPESNHPRIQAILDRHLGAGPRPVDHPTARSWPQ